MNDETIRGFVGIIDSLEFGEFTVKNVAYVNIETIDHSDSLQALCDSMLNSSFDIVLGMPVIKELGATVNRAVDNNNEILIVRNK